MAHYSIAIRTLGKAGEKYRKLLKCITELNQKPDKVVVVLPEGYSLPEDRLGCEDFLFCSKSMIGQRIKALETIDTEYTLFLDDDIEFEPDFVQKLLKPLESGLFDCSTGPLFSFFPASLAGKIAGTLTGSVSVSIFNRDKYVKILRDGGWSYHTFDTSVERYYPTESFAWTCFMIKSDVMRSLHMEDEKEWLERFGYACGDDRVMAYKLVKLAYKACVAANATYIHNDAKTSTASSEMDQYTPKFCMYYMHTVFWNRFIQEPENNRLRRIQNVICFTYWKIAMTVYLTIKALLSKSGKLRLKAFREGVKEGFRYINSSEYANILPIQREMRRE